MHIARPGAFQRLPCRVGLKRFTGLHIHDSAFSQPACQQRQDLAGIVTMKRRINKHDIIMPAMAPDKFQAIFTMQHYLGTSQFFAVFLQGAKHGSIAFHHHYFAGPARSRFEPQRPAAGK